ncbi:hypothetical protein AGMMS50284_6740 [Clostridia bacterium]|nr:hypothetical protein AGMMS50284_6740 [Clostridia bacterium]
MRSNKILTTTQLEKYIKNLYSQIILISKKDGVYTPLRTIFKECNPRGLEGEYCFSKDELYHFWITERGRLISKTTTSDLFLITYLTIEPNLFSLACNFELKNRINQQDTRRICFAKEAEYFSIIGEEFKKKFEKNISGILEKYPYDDTLC